METLTSFSPSTLPSLDLLDSMDNELTPQPFLKMEDLHTASSPAALSMDLMQTSPAPVIVHSKPAKKRKSWGQELPEPKTSLPPRKRAKTEDEKEQRRIERIKRNRAAAHNSRERKRQETETLAVALARANAELDAYRSLHGPLPASVVLPEVTLQIDEVDTPTPSLSESHGTVEYDTCPISPATHPENYIKQEALESTLLNITPAFNLDVKPAKASLHPLDPTQHSAAMLCDLQCRSSGPSPDVTSLPAIWWTQLFLYLMTFQLRTCSQTILMTIWSLSPSRMERLMQASTRRSTSLLMTSSMTPLLLRSMAMAQRNAATPTPIPQSATLALQRQSAMKLSGEMTNEVVRRRHLMLQSPALDRHQRKDADGRDREVADNAGSS